MLRRIALLVPRETKHAQGPGLRNTRNEWSTTAKGSLKTGRPFGSSFGVSLDRVRGCVYIYLHVYVCVYIYAYVYMFPIPLGTIHLEF